MTVIFATAGPAAGALGAALVARSAGFDRVLTLDGGGTSTDVSVVLGGEPTLTTEGSVGAFPSKIPMIDVVTVGAGGGSVAWLSPEGTLKVGPRSAGADPGPICYRKGGTEPTVTDAHLVLGRIPPHLLGGEVPLDVEAAREGLQPLGAKLALDLEPTAAGVLEISAWNQANALRQVTVKRGLDVREFVLVTFGGSGSLLLCRLLEVLGLRVAVVPRDPGNLSAFGLLTVDVKDDYVQTAVARHARLDLAAVAATYGSLQARDFDQAHLPTLVMSYRDCSVKDQPELSLEIVYTDDAMTAVLDTTTAVSVDTQHLTFSAQLRHFSRYVLKSRYAVAF